MIIIFFIKGGIYLVQAEVYLTFLFIFLFFKYEICILFTLFVLHFKIYLCLVYACIIIFCILIVWLFCIIQTKRFYFIFWLFDCFAWYKQKEFILYFDYLIVCILYKELKRVLLIYYYYYYCYSYCYDYYFTSPLRITISIY